MDETSHGPVAGLPGDAEDEDGGPVRRPLTLATLGFAVATCMCWWSAAITAYFIYASTRSDTIPASGCVRNPCPSERAALMTAGYFGLLPTAFVGLLVSLVVLVYAARSLRVPWLLGTVSALAGMVLGAIGFVTIATYDVAR